MTCMRGIRCTHIRLGAPCPDPDGRSSQKRLYSLVFVVFVSFVDFVLMLNSDLLRLSGVAIMHSVRSL